MNIIIKILLSIIVILIGYFMLHRIWTKDIDIYAWLKKPSETIPVKDYPIVVVPNNFRLSTAEWKSTQIFEVKNIRASETLYSVWVKLTADPKDFDISAVELFSETNEPFVSANVRDININYDLVEIIAEDASNAPCIYLLIYRINGLESKYFKVRTNLPKQYTIKSIGLSLQIKGYANEPSPIVLKEGASALRFTPPENLRIRTISVLTKKNL